MKNWIIAISLVFTLGAGLNFKGSLVQKTKSLVMGIAYQLAYWYCIKCGGTNSDDATQCRFCGRSR